MSEKPILFNTEMVKAVLSGRKTQTRRVVKPQPDLSSMKTYCPSTYRTYDERCAEAKFIDNRWYFSIPGMAVGDWKCPYGQVGDRLWVRETFYATHINEESTRDYGQIYYKADENPHVAVSWRPSIHMPRWASRINLEITNIRVERVQDISEEDALAEGIERSEWEYSCEPYRNYEEPKMSPGKNKSLPSASFCTLWDSINEKRGYGWKVNPWVWVVEFKVIA